MRQAFKEILERAYLRSMRIHELRHSTATILLTKEFTRACGDSWTSGVADARHLLRGTDASSGGSKADGRRDWREWLSAWLSTNEQPSDTTSQTAGIYIENLVSRLGIEPRTRRLRERLAPFRLCPARIFASEFPRFAYWNVRRFPLDAAR